MALANLASDGTLTLYNRVFNDFADDDISTLTYSDDVVTLKTGKNGNTIYSKNEAGRNGTMVMRLVRGSSDDQFLQNRISLMKQDFVSTELASGEFVLRMGDGEGVVTRDVITLKGGIFTRLVDSKENTSGDTEQGVSVYNIKFADADRSIQ